MPSTRWRLHLLLGAMAPGACLEEVRDISVAVRDDLNLLGHDRSADEEALCLVAVVLLQEVVLPRVFDAFGDHAQVQAVPSE